VVAASILVLMVVPTGLAMADANRLALWPATFVEFWAGARFLRAAWKAARHGDATMDTLVAVGTLAAWGYSAAITTWPDLAVAGGGTYFDGAAAIVGLILVGRWLEARARGSAADAIRALAHLQPARARVVRGGHEEDVDVGDVRVGDLVRIRPGERVPVDGVVVEGASTIDESMLTGESMPVARSAGEPVTGATINGAGGLLLRVSRVGADTALAQIIRLVDAAQASKAPVQRLADRIAGVFVPAVIGLSIVTLGAWLAVGPEPRVPHALTAAIAVLIIACPCALGLATPTAIMVGTGLGARRGILIAGGEALESAGRIDAIVLDKTGTLTQGRPDLVRTVGVSGISEATVLALAAAVERGSEHPVGGAIVRAAEAAEHAPAPDDAAIPGATGFLSSPGAGAWASVDGSIVAVGNRRLMTERGVDVAGLELAAGRIEADGGTPVFVARDGVALGLLGVADGLRAGAREAVSALRAMGLEPWLLTGDRPGPALAAAQAAGIAPDRVIAEVLPGEKADRVRGLQAVGHRVAMVGDGVNDGPALAAADLGIAVGGGSDVARAAAGITLVGDDPRSVPAALTLARATLRTIRQNLLWAFGYNVVLIPVAMGVLYPFTGLLLDPVLAAAAMALSSVSVVGNALRLRGATPARIYEPATGPHHVEAATIR
ncbi:MAG TPA: copper-translocating P-type ATPase, partial [Candidatus Limnocylindrales bacterium]|nr:copper-translocating P-type ATPase [Candidatus Limnocylindrales bacterium]